MKPDNIDIVIHSGDFSNSQDSILNEGEVLDFIEWFSKLPIKHKICIAGNHDTSIERGLITKETFEEAGIIYLNNETVEISGLKIWGSPYTPRFGTGWAFNLDREKIKDVWELIPVDTDVIITHGPPRGLLDTATKYYNEIEYCGCEHLRRKCIQINPKLVLFGHIHDNDTNYNAGYRTLSDRKTIYSNGTCVTDAKFSKGLTSHGNIFEI